jgi:arabinan endo-1,5-alpha-L-arabinosidase
MATFRNPVHRGYFADPFVLKVDDLFFAYGTGAAPGGRPFEVLESADLVHWESLGGALDPLEEEWATDYWAPEVACRDGVFHMYYSVGTGDRGHLLRVATASQPEGPFVDAGLVLTPNELFAIDAHPFRDDDGKWYLFYAHDVLEGERVGTTVAVDRMTSMTSLAGRPRTLLAPSDDWQLFTRGREIYDAVFDWHTLEGPFVRKRAGRYWLFYSGGSWQQAGYGVSYAVADHPMGPYSEPQPGPVILETVPGEVIGPGHNSLVSGPDGEDWIVYHAWDPDVTARQMWIDRLVWSEDGPRRSGPTQGPQVSP